MMRKQFSKSRFQSRQLREWVSPCESRVHFAIDATVSRIGATAFDGSTGLAGTPINLTWNIVPDGTPISPPPGTSYYSGTQGSNFSSTTSGLGDFTPYINNSFFRWSQLAGLSYAREGADDGADLWSTSGQLGVRADIRISARNGFSDSAVLAIDPFPPYSDMVFNSNRFAFLDSSGFFWTTLGGSSATPFMNTVMHEHGHGLGLTHEDPTNNSKLMEPSLSTAFFGPQFDDIRRAQWLYGDPFEKTGPLRKGRNDTIATANDIGTLANGTYSISNWGNANDPSQARSIAGTGDTDYLRFSISGLKRSVQFTVAPFGPSYSVAPQGGTASTLDASRLGNLTAAICDVNGTVITSANLTSYGASEVVTIPDLLPGTYYLKIGVSETSSISNAPTQAYNVTAAVSNYVPIAPANIRLAPEADSGLDNSDGITNIAQPIIKGTGSPGDSIVVYLRKSTGQLFGPISTTIGSDRTWSMQSGIPLPSDGTWTMESHTLYNNVDSATVVGPTMVLDRVLSPNPFSLNALDDSGTSNSDGITRINRPHFSISGDELLRLTINAYTQPTINGYLLSAGTFTLQFDNAFADGAYAVNADVSDVAGNSAVRSININIDTVAQPVAVYLLNPLDDTGISSADGITRVRNPRFQFSTSETNLASMVATASIGGIPVQNANGSLAGGGQWSILPDGVYGISFAVSDKAGNSSTNAGATMTIDNVAPAAPQFDSFAASPNQFLRAHFLEAVVMNSPLSLSHLQSGQTYSFVPTSPVPTANPVFQPLPIPGNPSGRLDRDGQYRVTGTQGVWTDFAGNTLSQTQPWFDFGYLRADFNGDRAVNFSDLLILAQHYAQSSGAEHAQGDVDYDGDVDFSDLLVVAQTYGQSLVANTPSRLKNSMLEELA